VETVSFRTIAQPAAGLYKEKGSKFMAFAFPVQTEEEIQLQIGLLKKKYFDARHHCFAWMLGPGKQTFRAFDDGEPGHSAGDPILGQIRSHDLTDILIVVVRYFGGVKLGVGGLIHAYRSASADALAHARIVEKEVMQLYRVVVSFPAMPLLMRLIKETSGRVVKQEFQATHAKVVAEIPLRHSDHWQQRLQVLQATQPGMVVSEMVLPGMAG
jgi:uncharacterized YigZ family protein